MTAILAAIALSAASHPQAQLIIPDERGFSYVTCFDGQIIIGGRTRLTDDLVFQRTPIMTYDLKGRLIDTYWIQTMGEEHRTADGRKIYVPSDETGRLDEVWDKSFPKSAGSLDCLWTPNRVFAADDHTAGFLKDDQFVQVDLPIYQYRSWTVSPTTGDIYWIPRAWYKAAINKSVYPYDVTETIRIQSQGKEDFGVIPSLVDFILLDRNLAAAYLKVRPPNQPTYLAAVVFDRSSGEVKNLYEFHVEDGDGGGGIMGPTRSLMCRFSDRHFVYMDELGVWLAEY